MVVLVAVAATVLAIALAVPKRPRIVVRLPAKSTRQGLGRSHRTDHRGPPVDLVELPPYKSRAHDGIIQVSDLLAKQIDKLTDESTNWSQSGGVAGRIAWGGAQATVLKKISDRLAFDALIKLRRPGAESDLRAFKDETKHPRDKSEPFELGPNEVKLDAYPRVILRVGPSGRRPWS